VLRPTLLASTLLAALPALAQQSAPDPARSSTGQSSATTLDTVTVTGEKTSRSLQDTTASVAVTTSARIEQENLRNLSDVIERTANVTPMYGARGFTIRGIADEAGAANPLATTYLDGAALPGQASDASPTDLWDIAQVEVFRGPQSTIQGENALAGAIVIRTEDPTMDWSGRARVLLSDPSDRRVSFAGGGPLVDDELAFRLALENRDFDGYVRNATRQVPEDALDSTMARAKLLWTPKSLPGLTARLGYTRDDRQGPYMYVYSRLDLPDPLHDPVNLSDDPNTTDSLSQIANLEVDYDLGGPWSLSSVTSWTDTAVKRHFDGDLTAEKREYSDTEEQYDSRSQELRLRYAGQRLTGLAGLYWSRRDMSRTQLSRTNIDTPVSTIAGVLQGSGFPAAASAQIAGLYAQALPVIPVDYFSDSPSRSENLALFSDGEYELGQHLALLAGFRYDRQEYTFASDTTADFVGSLPDPAAFGAPGTPLSLAVTGINQAVLALVQQASGGRTASTTRDFKAFLPKAGLRWSWDADRSLALTLQRGYRSGGSSYNIARSQVFAFDPEYTWNYELALRTQWLDRRLTLNANAYYIDWKDKQTTAFFGLNSYDYQTVNAGRAHLYGFEVESGYRVSEGFDAYASLGFARTRYDEFTLPQDAELQIDYSGREFAYAPHWTVAVGGNWRWGDGWLANLNANWRDRVHSGVDDDAPVLSSRLLVNARFGYENTDWSAYVFARNLLDRGYVQYRWSDEPTGIVGAPRVVGIGFDYRW
jgi:iron complex outermembrane receptor protein